MSSVTRSLSQIPVRSKFLVAIADDVCGNTIEECSAFSGEWLGSVVESVSGSVYSYSAGNLFRDLGRQMMIADAATGAHIALYREALPQGDADTEGVSAAPVWLRVWAANGVAVHVARLG
jgi:hypothetical protein